MTLTMNEIKDLVDSGKSVYWKQSNYKVIKDRIGQYLIVCSNNNDCVGLISEFTKKDTSDDFLLAIEKMLK